MRVQGFSLQSNVCIGAPRGGQGEASVGNPRGPNILSAAKVTSLSNACETHESFVRRRTDIFHYSFVRAVARQKMMQ
jgi:hypothetical protein